MVQSGTNKKLLSFRLSPRAIQLLEALAIEQGVSKTSVLEIMIRKQAGEVEDAMPAVYAILHDLEA